MNKQKKAIALLITLLFIILITASIGLGLKYINDTAKQVEDERLLYQSTIIVDDILELLKKSKEIQNIKDQDSLDIFLSEKSFIPIEFEGMKIGITLKSARSKIDINSLKNSTIKIELLQSYMDRYMANSNFIYVILDILNSTQQNTLYNSDILSKKPQLFRGNIVSYEHFMELENFFQQENNDKTLKNIDFKELFYFSNDNNYTIDLNQANEHTWEFLLNCQPQRAQQMVKKNYKSYEDLGLNDEELNIIKNVFKTSFFEPYIDVNVDISKDDSDINIEFQYDIKNKKGGNFVFKI